jgi:1,4-alpha-glucan branching enzyme
VLKKGPVDGGKRSVTFELSGGVSGETVHLVGEFNDWSSRSLPLERNEAGDYEVTVLVEAGRKYRYRYLVDGVRWENDWAADDYVPNQFGGEDSVLQA